MIAVGREIQKSRGSLKFELVILSIFRESFSRLSRLSSKHSSKITFPKRSVKKFVADFTPVTGNKGSPFYSRLFGTKRHGEKKKKHSSANDQIARRDLILPRPSEETIIVSFSPSSISKDVAVSKKRKPSAGKPNRSPTSSPRLAPRTVASENVSQRARSSHNLKRRRLQQQQRGNAKQQRKLITDDARVSGEPTKKDAFGSLESLFDVRRPLELPEVRPFARRYARETVEEYSSSDSDDLRDFKSLVTDLYGPSNRSNHEPDIILPPGSKFTATVNRNLSKLEELAFDVVEESFFESWKESESSLISDRLNSDMAEEERTVDPEGHEVGPEPSAPPEEIVGGEPRADVSLSIEEIPEEPEEGRDGTIGNGEPGNRDSAKPPEYPLPAGLGEGVPLRPGDHRESTISSTPLTDLQVIEEMKETEERCNIVRQEMNEIKKQIAELKDKKDVTEEDAKLLKEKQASLMTKMQEFYEMTRKIQRILGLADPSSQTFAKMFEMLPYPHTKLDTVEEDAAAQKSKDAAERERDKRRIAEKDDFGDSFDLPQPEYPEDKLPRAIVCGFTEDKIPKIVIPDSRPKGTRCLKNLTGKLSESLNMQEKLAHENAKLEGGKYKLEEALLEKDNTLDCLQRKVCGLQAEMRIVVKENTELNRQLASTKNQRSARSQVCCSTCPGEGSPRSTQPHQSSYSYASSSRRDDESCRCSRCLQEQSGDYGAPETSTVCVNPDGSNLYQKPCAISPRLSGGGSREGGSYFTSPSTDPSSAMCCRGPATAKNAGPPSRGGACPAEMENQLTSYGNNTNQLAQQLDSMESEVRNMQMELANVHRERQQLEQQRKLLKCTGPCAPCSCCPPGMPQPSSSSHNPLLVPCVSGGSAPPPTPQQLSLMTEPPNLNSKMAQHQTSASCSGACVIAPMGASTCPQQQLRDLREQYARLQEDYRNKLCEVSCLRADADKLKQETREAKEEREKADNRLVDVQARLKSMETERLRFHGSKEQLVEQEQALLVAKQRYREAQDELEELRSLIQDQANQLEDYRNKYLQAQETVEEQRRQLDLMEMDNARMNENVTLEIGRVKNQFQEKLAELAPLPDILKQTQAKLQEVQQMRLIAERNCEDLSRELLTCKDKLGTMQSQLSALRSENSALQDQNGSGSGRCEELEKKNSELRSENERMKNAIARAEDHDSQLQQRLDEKMHEAVQLTAMLEQVREDSARQVARTKERCETVRRTMQGQIAEMEKQLAQCRATARAAQKDRDEIRQKMQGQINNLNEAFDQAQGRIRSLQGHVNYLKTSYSNIFSPAGQGETPAGFMASETAGQPQGYDSCDCNY